MAKKTTARQRAPRAEGTNKSKAIRDYFTAHPAATAKDVVAALGKRGISVSEAYVYMNKPKRRRKATARHGVGRRGRGEMVSIDQLVAAKKFADGVGGIEQARELVSTLAKLG